MKSVMGTIWVALETAEGVHAVLKLLRAELLEAMALCGCPDLDSITSELLAP